MTEVGRSGPVILPLKHPYYRHLFITADSCLSMVSALCLTTNAATYIAKLATKIVKNCQSKSRIVHKYFSEGCFVTLPP